MKLTILLSIFLSGCTYYTGFALHNTGRGQPDYNAENPIGIFGGEYQDDRFILFCEHHSRLASRETGLGYNLCGAKYLLNP